MFMNTFNSYHIQINSVTSKMLDGLDRDMTYLLS
jgi:hypothetical protein